MKNNKSRIKDPNLLEKVRTCLNNGEYRLSNHALERGKTRNIQLTDILEVLQNGWHESKKDIWEEQFLVWNYSIRGKTIDERSCRVIVSFEENGLLIITVIHLKG